MKQIMGVAWKVAVRGAVVGLALGVGVCCGAAFAQPAVGEAPQPAEARTTTEVEASFDRLLRTAMDEAYAAHGRRDPSWDADARAIMNIAALDWSPGATMPERAEILRVARRVVDGKCADPMIRALGLAMWYAQDAGIASTATRRAALAAALREPEVPHWPASAVVRAYDALWLMCVDAKDEAGEALALEGVAAAFVRGATREGRTADEERMLLRHALRLENPRYDPAPMEAAVRAGVPEPSWIREMVLGTAAHRRAWDARGRGFVGSVKEESWPKFAQHMQAAAAHFRAAYALDPSRPEPASEMVRVVMTGHAGEGETLLGWFDRAVAAQADYAPACQHVLWALRPRWGGSHEKMLAFGLRCARTGRADTLAPLFLLRAIEEVMDDAGDPEEPLSYEGVYEAAAEVLEARARRDEAAGNSAGARAMRSINLALAWHAQEYEAGREVLDRLGETFDRGAAERFRDSTDLFEDVLAFSSAGGESIIEAWGEVMGGNPGKAIALADEAMELIDRTEDPRGWLATDYQRRGIALLASAAKGWTSTTPAAEHPLWSVRHGDWTRTDDGWWVSSRHTHDVVLLTPPVGTRVRWRATVQFDAPESFGQAGLVFHWEWASKARSRWRVFTVSPARGDVYLSNGFGTSSVGRVPRDPGGRYVLELDAREDRCVATVNGRVVVDGPLPKDASWEPGYRVGLGTSRMASAATFTGIGLWLPPAPADEGEPDSP